MRKRPGCSSGNRLAAVSGITQYLLHDAARVRAGARLQADFAEGRFVLVDVLLQHVEQGLGLLGAEVDALEVADGDRVGLRGLQRAEQEEEVPQADAELH